MLFRRKIERSCEYCLHGAHLEDDSVLCVKKGLRIGLGPCWKFKYDPYKRIPKRARAIDFSKFDKEDFSL